MPRSPPFFFLPAPPPELLLLLLLLLSPPLLLLIFTLVGASELFPDFAVAPAAGGAALDAAGGLVNSQLVAPPCASERCTKPDASAADIISVDAASCAKPTVGLMD